MVLNYTDELLNELSTHVTSNANSYDASLFHVSSILADDT
jgi:hypothetical protein